MTKTRDTRQPKPPGRKSKLMPAVHEASIQSLIFGASDFAAAQAAGISDHTFYNWLERGKTAEDLEDEGEPIPGTDIPFLQFFQDVRRARGHAVSSAESGLFFEDPGMWLTRGPQARTRHDRDGWSRQVAVIAPSGGPDRDLRHTAATLMMSRGVHPKVVSEMLGHSQIGITLDLYSHVTPTMQRDAVAEIDAAIQGVGSRR